MLAAAHLVVAAAVEMNGRNVTDHCDKLFVDVGANTGQSLHQWYHSSDAGHGMSEFKRAATWAERRRWCADVFEANPSWSSKIMREVTYQRQAHKIDIRTYLGTPFSTSGGTVDFLRVDGIANMGGTLSGASDNSIGGNKVSQLQAMDGVRYLHDLPATHLALKIDVENFEFKLLRDLIASGALCSPRHPRVETHMFVEWHLPRPCPTCEGGVRQLFNVTTEGLPAGAVQMMEMLTWMLKGKACHKTVKLHRWW